MKPGELFNTLTHLVGAVLALAAAVVLVVFASLKGEPWKIVSFSVYGVCLFALYLFSTLYHATSGKTKRFFSILDHQAIYLLIAGTYTPFTLITLKGAWGWSIFGTIWGIALAGVILESFPVRGKLKTIISVITYVTMGWIVLIALQPLLQNLQFAGFIWLLIGGLFYSVGVVFYAFSSKYTYAHGIWHLFVLAGSACHYVSILFYVS